MIYVFLMFLKKGGHWKFNNMRESNCTKCLCPEVLYNWPKLCCTKLYKKWKSTIYQFWWIYGNWIKLTHVQRNLFFLCFWFVAFCLTYLFIFSLKLPLWYLKILITKTFGLILHLYAVQLYLFKKNTKSFFEDKLVNLDKI